MLSVLKCNVCQIGLFQCFMHIVCSDLQEEMHHLEFNCFDEDLSIEDLHTTCALSYCMQCI